MKEKMRIIDKKAIRAASNEKLFDSFLKESKGFIKNVVTTTTKKYITDSDDEWSIALIAFSEAVKTYAYEKGNFFSYAQMIIKHRLIDYYRVQNKYNCEYYVSPDMFDIDSKENDDNKNIKLAIADKVTIQKDNSIKDEIEQVNIELKKYGFSFFDLVECSPKSKKTKNACKQIVLYILNNNKLIDEIKLTKQLPIKKIQKNIYLPRKLIERYRKYLIAMLMILSGEYPYLANYVSYIKKGGS